MKVWHTENQVLIFGQPLQVTICLCYGTIVLSVPSVCNVGVLWPNGWMDQDATWYRGRPRPRRHCVKWGPSFPNEKGHRSPHFSAHLYCGQMAEWLEIPLGTERKGHSRPHFLAHVYCGQTVAYLTNC